MDEGRRTRLVREISEILSELDSPLAAQFIAFVTKENESGDIGGLSGRFPGPVTSLTLLNEREIVSIDSECKRIQRHTTTIRSLGGGWHNYLGAFGVLLDDGTFLAGGGGHGNLRRFSSLSGVKIKSISAGGEHYLMLSESGRVFSMLAKGEYANNIGQLGTGDMQDYYEPVEMRGIPKIRKIQAGCFASSLLDEDGGVWVCGNGSNHFPFENNFVRPTKIAVGADDIFSGFDSRVVFVRGTSGRIVSGGANTYGQCGVGFTSSHPYGVTEWTDIKFEGENPLDQGKLRKISGSEDASFLLLANGTIFSCGIRNENGFSSQKTRFTRIKSFAERGERVLDFACGANFSVFLTDSGRVYMVGGFDRYGHVRDSLERFGKRVKVPNDEVLWEIVWRNGSDREELRNKISAGGKFKISIWQQNDPHVFIIEQVTREIIEDHRESLKKKLEEKMRELAADLTRGFERGISKRTSEKSTLVKELNEAIQKSDREVKEMRKQLEELNRAVRKKEREIEVLEKTIQKDAKEIGALQRNVAKFAESAQTSEILTLLRAYDAFLLPLDSLRHLEGILHFFDFSGGRKEDEIFKFYKNSKGEFESNEQRSAVEKITDILKIYKVLKESPHTKKHFEFPGAEIKFESIDRVYSNFFKCLNLAKNSENTSDVFSLLDSFFRYFGVLDFDLNSLTLFVSSLSDTLSEELQDLRQKLSENLKNPPKKAHEVPKYPPTSEGALQKYLRSFGGVFFDKFSFLVLEIVSRFVASLSKELANWKTQKVLRGAIRKVSEHHWNELKSSESVPKSEENDENTQAKLLESLKSIHIKSVQVDEKIVNAKGRRERGKYRKELDKIQQNLKNALVTFLSFRIGESEPTDEKVLRELLGVFRTLGIVEGTPKREEIVEILDVDFDFELDELREKLLETPKQSTTSKEFSVIGFRNFEMEEKELFYDSTGDLKEKYTEIPNIEGYKGKPLAIFIKFYAKDEIAPNDIQIKFVHLFSGECFGLNHPECENSAPLTLKKLRDWNAFQITIPNLKYSGEFALVVGLRSDASKHQTFFHRKIFNVFPQDAIPEDI